MKFRIIAALGALSLATQPVAAQEDASEDDAALAMMAALFKTEPLTAEQQARLPAARAVVEKIMPPGTMAEVMGSMFDGILDPMMQMAIEPSADSVSEELGLQEEPLDLSQEEAIEVAAILDPAWTERRTRELAAMKEAMATLMSAMEPGMRKGMAEAFAVHFSATELADIGVFFATPSGAAYARKSYALASDPRVMAAAMESMPALMASFATMEAEMKAATADLPARRTYANLTAEQQARLAALTGLTEDEIAAGMAAAAESRAAAPTM